MKRLASLLLAVGLSAAGYAQSEVPTHTAQNTTVTSDSCVAVKTDTENVITFTKNVKVVGTDMVLTCDNLRITTYLSGDSKAPIGKYGQFKTLLATGNVRIAQVGRIATCGRAEVLPGEDRVVLTDHPEVKDESDKSDITGYRMTLFRNQQKVLVEGDPNEKLQIVMPDLKDLGFDGGAVDSDAKGKKK